MANTTEEVPAAPRIEPDIDSVLTLIQSGGEIDQAEKKQGEALSTVGKLFQRIEKNMHANRGAVQFIRRLQKMSDDKRADFLRTAEPLMVELGYTLDHIDSGDLVSQSAAPKNEPPASTSNEAVSPLEEARNALTGDTSVEPGTAPVTDHGKGSVQLRKFIGHLRAGKTVEEAADAAGIEMGEAKLHAEAEDRGGYADIVDPIGPPKGRPKLGVVAGGAK